MKNRITKSIFLGVSTAVIASASYALISTQQEPAKSKNVQLSIPAVAGDIEQTGSIALRSEPIVKVSAAKAPDFDLTNYLIKPGDSLSTIFSKLDLNKTALHKITHANDAGKQFASILPGKTLAIKTASDGTLEQLTYKKNAIETFIAKRSGDEYTVEKQSKEIEHRTASAQATIHTSLFWDGKEAGLSDKAIMEMAEIFAWDIDFALSLREGDNFTVLYEKLYIDGKEFDTGDILAAEFVNQGQTYTAVRYQDKNGENHYYTPEGKSMRKAFLRTPVDFARISSHFNLKRKHPVLNKIRAHKGVDYAAKTGTPVKSTGKGKIIFRGHKGGYGKVVIVQHGQSYSTLYAHLSNFRKGQKVGSRIMQGQVIGYVGKTGLATGPHLHYEFRVNGVHRNPLTVRLPNDKPIDKSLLAEFKEQTQPLLTQLIQTKTTLLAQNDI